MLGSFYGSKCSEEKIIGSAGSGQGRAALLPAALSARCHIPSTKYYQYHNRHNGFTMISNLNLYVAVNIISVDGLTLIDIYVYRALWKKKNIIILLIFFIYSQ